LVNIVESVIDNTCSICLYCRFCNWSFLFYLYILQILFMVKDMPTTELMLTIIIDL